MFLPRPFYCHSSYSGVMEFCRNILDFPVSKGQISKVLNDAVNDAKAINKSQDLSGIKIGAHDEIFQSRIPVLVGCDVKSTYTYLLKKAEHRDGTTWGTHLLDLCEQGIDLDYTIADAGKGLRKGQKEAWPDTICRGDVFHPMMDMSNLVSFLENKVISAEKKVKSIKSKMKRDKENFHENKTKLKEEEKEYQQTIVLAKDVAILSDWIEKDILSLIGADHQSRLSLLQFVVEELKLREHQSHRIRPIRRLLEKQGEELLCFVKDIDKKLRNLAKTYQVKIEYIYELFELEKISKRTTLYWRRLGALFSKVGDHCHNLREDLQEVVEDIVRASSMAENLNSRLRGYFFLRKMLGDNYLELMQFFLNHRRFRRSLKEERIGKSPTELLTGQTHPHWLEMLGYSLFKQTATQQEKFAA